MLFVSAISQYSLILSLKICSGWLPTGVAY